MKNHRYTDEQRAWIIEHYKGITTTELTHMFNLEFGAELNQPQIRNYVHNRGLRNGVVTRFKTGNIPANKGTKGVMKANQTSFKKGELPPNHRKVGSERVNIYGYVEIKIKEPRKWVLKHHYLWEQENGALPKGYKLLFLDGNKTNLALDNLHIITAEEMLVLNKKKLLTTHKNLTKTGVLVAKVIVASNKRVRK